MSNIRAHSYIHDSLANTSQYISGGDEDELEDSDPISSRRRRAPSAKKVETGSQSTGTTKKAAPLHRKGKQFALVSSLQTDLYMPSLLEHG